MNSYIFKLRLQLYFFSLLFCYFWLHMLFWRWEQFTKITTHKIICFKAMVFHSPYLATLCLLCLIPSSLWKETEFYVTTRNKIHVVKIVMHTQHRNWNSLYSSVDVAVLHDFAIILNHILYYSLSDVVKHFTVEWFAFLLHIREVMGSDFCLGDQHLCWQSSYGFPQFLQVNFGIIS